MHAHAGAFFHLGALIKCYYGSGVLNSHSLSTILLQAAEQHQRTIRWYPPNRPNMSSFHLGWLNQFLDDDAQRILAANTPCSGSYQKFERHLQIMCSLDAYRHHSDIVREIIITGQRLERQKNALHVEKERAPRHTLMRRVLHQQVNDIRHELEIMREEMAEHRNKAVEARDKLEAYGLSGEEF
ncbi:hypothetical protein PMIN06_007749 [Paraphaeosphaeria minitans]